MSQPLPYRHTTPSQPVLCGGIQCKLQHGGAASGPVCVLRVRNPFLRATTAKTQIKPAPTPPMPRCTRLAGSQVHRLLTRHPPDQAQQSYDSPIGWSWCRRRVVAQGGKLKGGGRCEEHMLMVVSILCCSVGVMRPCRFHTQGSVTPQEYGTCKAHMASMLQHSTVPCCAWGVGVKCNVCRRAALQQAAMFKSPASRLRAGGLAHVSVLQCRQHLPPPHARS